MHNVPMSGPQNQYFNHIMRSVTFHKLSCIHKHFWNRLVSNQCYNSGNMFVYDVLQIPSGCITPNCGQQAKELCLKGLQLPCL